MAIAGALAGLCGSLPAQDLILPPVKTTLPIENEAIPVVVTGVVSKVSAGADQALFRVKLNAGLEGLQEDATALLRDQLNQSNHCGERLSLERATLAAAVPAALLTAEVHFEKWACVKAFGREVTRKLIGGNGTILVKLSPAVGDGRSVKLVSEVVSVQADGPLGDALRSGSLGESLREKIRASLQSALEKGMNFEAVVPATLASVLAIRDVQFRDAGGGRLACEFLAEARLSAERMHAVMDQLKTLQNVR